MSDEIPKGIKRFYKSVDAKQINGETVLVLDERAAKTRNGHALRLSTPALARAIVEEWDGQDMTINMALMPMTRYQMTVLDAQDEDLARWRDELLRIIAGDLLCYRVDSPDRLVKRQAEHWDPVLKTIEDNFDLSFLTTQAILAITQPPETIALFTKLVTQFDPSRLLILRRLAEISASTILALALVEGEIDLDQFMGATWVDEDHQIEQWGEDEEAQIRRRAMELDINQAYQFLKLSTPS